MKILDLMMLLSSVDKLKKNKEKDVKNVDLKFSYSVKTDKDENSIEKNNVKRLK